MGDSAPPIDRELAGSVWPGLVERAEATAELSPSEFVSAARNGPPPNADLELGGRVVIEETTIADADGVTRLPVVILRPGGRPSSGACLYHVAGGRMRQSARLSLTAVEANWIAEYGLTLVSVAPRVGPEHRHPAQVEDAVAGLGWIHDAAGDLGVDGTRVIIMGKGGGGGVAAATALYARDFGGPEIVGQILIAPMLDDRRSTVSSRFEVAPWPAHSNEIAWWAVLGSAAGGIGVGAYAAAARADDLSGLPPTYLEVGSSEVMRDEVLRYAARLAQCGVPVEFHLWQGGFHAFDQYAPEAEISRACIAARTSYLSRLLRDVEH